MRLYSADKGTAIKTLTGFSDYVFAVAISPDGTRFLMIRSEATQSLPQFRVVFNWTDAGGGAAR